MPKTISIALVGNPNSGKTTLFNVLTGANQHVGNWPGVTVEKKSGQLKEDKHVTVQDLPGIYSLSPYSTEELITRRYLTEQMPDRLIDVIDATNLERNLYLTLQLMETGVPIVLALNMIDLVKKQHRRRINLQKLAYILGVPTVSISALKHQHLDNLTHLATEEPSTKAYPYPQYDPRIESALSMILDLLPTSLLQSQRRFWAIKLFERDQIAWQAFHLTPHQKNEIEKIIASTEKIFNDSSDSIIVNARYDLIAKIIQLAVVDLKDFSVSISDRVDQIVTNRWLALPIFVLVMWAVYYLSIQTIGTIGSDWVNDTLFGAWI
ncbi:ferrous iron transporter B, partial [Lentilactobacillus raoultii]